MRTLATDTKNAQDGRHSVSRQSYTREKQSMPRFASLIPEIRLRIQHILKLYKQSTLCTYIAGIIGWDEIE